MTPRKNIDTVTGRSTAKRASFMRDSFPRPAAGEAPVIRVEAGQGDLVFDDGLDFSGLGVGQPRR